MLAGCAPRDGAMTCAAPLRPAVEVNLYFGRGVPGGGEVSDAAWTSFLAEVVTPRFPAGLSVLEVEGQHRDRAGTIGRERTKLVVVVVPDPPSHRPRVGEIVDAYVRRFGQEAVFQVERPVCAGL
ncbi:MAG: DUF3574 domain-containing protein [Reyranellaceae bacterium]